METIPFFDLPVNGKNSVNPKISQQIPIAPAANSPNYDQQAFNWCLAVHNKRYEFVEGSRHNYMLRLAHFCNTYGIQQHYCKSEFLSHFQGNGMDEKEITDIITYCYRNTNQFGQRVFIKYYKDVLKPPPTQTGILTDEFIRTCLIRDERGDAELFAHIYAGKKLYEYKSSQWLEYQAGRWVVDEKKKTRKDAIETLTKIYGNYALEVKEQIEEFSDIKNDTVNKQVEPLQQLHQKLLKRVAALNKNARSKSTLELAEMYLGTVITEFDTEPHLLNLTNGVYDFYANQLRPHSPSDRFLHQSKVRFEPDATCEKWIAFLNKVFNSNQALISFIQRCVGYSLTGFTDLQALLFCYGDGANGKSVFFTVLQLLLEEYYVSIPIIALLTRSIDCTTEYYLASIKGARMVVASEIPRGRKLNESQVKDLTGGDRINGRFPHGKPFSFNPTHTQWMFGNHKPIIEGIDHGIWRRMKLIPFTVTIPKNERKDMSVMKKEFKAELSGILNWAIDGYKDLAQNGWQFPQEVETATQEYQNESDNFASFMEDCCIENRTGKCLLKELFEIYQEWCKQKEYVPYFKDSKQMSTELRLKGFTVEKGTGNCSEVKGLTIRGKEQ